jgi:hypothetical protein
MDKKLAAFYHECLLPEIIDSRKARNLSIRDPPQILDAQFAHRQRNRTNKENITIVPK